MWTCIECENEYTHEIDGDAEERMCDSCINKEETEKRERELMEEEKRYYADNKITWGVSFNARNEEEAIEWLKEQYKDDYGIDLNDDEIIKLEEE